ncbi:RNA polymerase sigma factor|uniref:RNA polymerase sigma-70 factor, ECF subfamily n=1 Tax=Dendrosporobacter quercicolus TaxID=146817 RepID=A0A1G9SGV7_9FIRM|nr:RNA polymerase sigma factor [Dendrosporobacter quercicolus]NSL48719.1 RNA polymerase sigma factor [Dendrosporobacter quercicolus DSM 1736]SDM34724.1 RNA polymerase sigma-70 factor, ECF subfamily [Dendrosporobacter quercicolus]
MNDESTLIAKAKAGDREALNTLISNYWQPVYRLIYHRLGNEDDARELTQDTLMKAFRALPRYQILTVPFKRYLQRIAVNLVTDFWRKNGRMPKAYDIAEYQEFIVDRSERPEEYALRLENEQQIARLVEGLPEDQRQAIKLRVILGLSIRDTALQMNRTEPAVKMLQQRALKNLRNQFIRNCTEQEG